MSGFVSGVIGGMLILALADGEYTLAIAFLAMLCVAACWMMESIINAK